MVFCDTSTLAKYYVPEAESPKVRGALDRASVVSASDLTRTELMAVFHRRWREGKWDQGTMTHTMRQFEQDDLSGYWGWVPVDRAVTDLAARMFASLPSTVFLRAADAIHLATAMRQGAKALHTHDVHQAKAAAVLGIRVITL